MKNVYAISYDIRFAAKDAKGEDAKGDWVMNENGQPLDCRNVLSEGDARTACDKLEAELKREGYGDQHVTEIEIMKVEMIARNVLA